MLLGSVRGKATLGLAAVFSLLAATAAPAGALTCSDDLQSWQSIISYRPSAEIQQQLKVRKPGWAWRVQPIEDGLGDVVLDLYEIEIEKPPQIEGKIASDQQLYDYVRLNLDEFLDPKIGRFRPVEPSVDGARWRSNNYSGAVMAFDFFISLMGKPVSPDSGAVLAVQMAPMAWRFLPTDTGFSHELKHPLSGGREFGIRKEGSKAIFYTRASDRLTRWVDAATNAVPLIGGRSGLIFNGAERYWADFQQRLAKFVEQRSGKAGIRQPVVIRCPWDPIRSKYHKPTVAWQR